jgi:hypothetical protein
MLGTLEGCKLGALVGAQDFVGGSESKLLGCCDGCKLGTLLGAVDFVGWSEATVLGFLKFAMKGYAK